MVRRVRVLVGAALILIAAPACAPETGGGVTPVFKDGRCVGTEGVTIVVDFAAFRNEVVVRCALGAQANGYAVLDHTAFSHDPGRYPGSVCQLDGLPTQGHPFCGSTGGYWSYWKSTTAGGPWVYSEWGPTAGPVPGPGAVEGWRFAPFAEGTAKPPRVGTSGPVTP